MRETDREEEAEEHLRARDQRAELLDQLVVLALEPLLQLLLLLLCVEAFLSLSGVSHQTLGGRATRFALPGRGTSGAPMK